MKLHDTDLGEIRSAYHFKGMATVGHVIGDRWFEGREMVEAVLINTKSPTNPSGLHCGISPWLVVYRREGNSAADPRCSFYVEAPYPLVPGIIMRADLLNRRYRRNFIRIRARTAESIVRKWDEAERKRYTASYDLKPGRECDFSTQHLEKECNRANAHGITPHDERGEAVACVGGNDDTHLHLCKKCTDTLLGRQP